MHSLGGGAVRDLRGRDDACEHDLANVLEPLDVRAGARGMPSDDAHLVVGLADDVGDGLGLGFMILAIRS